MTIRSRSPRVSVVVMTAILAACGQAGGSGPGSGSGSEATEPATTPTPSATILVIEDAGLETEMPPGTYESRLFEPTIRLELGEGWFRRDPGADRGFNLRRMPDGEEDLTFVSGLDYLQCGATPAVEQPDVATIIDGLATSPLLDTSDPVEVDVGGRTGTEIRLLGGGDPVPEEDFGRSNEFGCIGSNGEAPFPADSAWLMWLPDTVQQLVFVDVDGTTVIIRSRPADDPDGYFDFILEILATTSLG